MKNSLFNQLDRAGLVRRYFIEKVKLDRMQIDGLTNGWNLEQQAETAEKVASWAETQGIDIDTEGMLDPISSVDLATSDPTQDPACVPLAE